MMEETKTSILRLIRPLALAASFVLAILVFCCRGDNSFMLCFDLYGAMDELMISFGVGSLLCCVLMLGVPTESARARTVWIVLATVSCLAGLLVALLSAPADAVAAALVCGALLGFGTIGLIGQWCCVFAQLPERAIPFTIALSFFFGTVLWFVLQVVDSFSITCIALMVFALCGGLLLALTVPAQRARGKAPGKGFASTIQNTHVVRNTEEYDREKQQFESSLANASSSPGAARPVKVRPALTLLDSFTMQASKSVSWAHAFEALGGVVVSFFILGILYWPDAIEVAQSRALLKPLGYALAGIVVFVVSARGSMSSLASGGMDRLRRTVIIMAACVVVASTLLIPHSMEAALEVVRFANNLGIAVLMLFGFITSFIHILHHDPSPTGACAVVVLCGGVGMSLGILVFLEVEQFAYAIGSLVVAAYLVTLVVFSLIEKR